jgi:hypothetical protein
MLLTLDCTGDNSSCSKTLCLSASKSTRDRYIDKTVFSECYAFGWPRFSTNVQSFYGARWIRRKYVLAGEKSAWAHRRKQLTTRHAQHYYFITHKHMHLVNRNISRNVLSFGDGTFVTSSTENHFHCKAAARIAVVVVVT